MLEKYLILNAVSVLCVQICVLVIELSVVDKSLFSVFPWIGVVGSLSSRSRILPRIAAFTIQTNQTQCQNYLSFGKVSNRKMNTRCACECFPPHLKPLRLQAKDFPPYRQLLNHLS